MNPFRDYDNIRNVSDEDPYIRIIAGVIKQALYDLCISPYKRNGQLKDRWWEILDNGYSAYIFFTNGEPFYTVTPEMKKYIYEKARKEEGAKMLPEKFFEEYAKTGVMPENPDKNTKPKDTYTRAEVDEIVNKKIAEALESMKENNDPSEDETTENDYEEESEE